MQCFFGKKLGKMPTTTNYKQIIPKILSFVKGEKPYFGNDLIKERSKKSDFLLQPRVQRVARTKKDCGRRGVFPVAAAGADPTSTMSAGQNMVGLVPPVKHTVLQCDRAVTCATHPDSSCGRMVTVRGTGRQHIKAVRYVKQCRYQ